MEKLPPFEKGEPGIGFFHSLNLPRLGVCTGDKVVFPRWTYVPMVEDGVKNILSIPMLSDTVRLDQYAYGNVLGAVVIQDVLNSIGMGTATIDQCPPVRRYPIHPKGIEYPLVFKNGPYQHLLIDIDLLQGTISTVCLATMEFRPHVFTIEDFFFDTEGSNVPKLPKWDQCFPSQFVIEPEIDTYISMTRVTPGRRVITYADWLQIRKLCREPLDASRFGQKHPREYRNYLYGESSTVQKYLDNLGAIRAWNPARPLATSIEARFQLRKQTRALPPEVANPELRLHGEYIDDVADKSCSPTILPTKMIVAMGTDAGYASQSIRSPIISEIEKQLNKKEWEACANATKIPEANFNEALERLLRG